MVLIGCMKILNYFCQLNIMILFCGDHFKDHIKYKKHKIRLNSSDAFGSGAHPTTEGCIKAIKFLNKNKNKFIFRYR